MRLTSQERLGLAGAGAGREERRALEERAVGDGGVDPRQVLQDRPAGAEVQVADLGVAHLPRRQTDGVLGGSQRGVRPAREQAAPVRHRGGGDRVGGRVAADPEPIEDDEDDRVGDDSRGGAAGAGGQSGPGDDPGHLVGLQRGATDQRAIDARLGQELRDVRGGDAPAVQDRQVLGGTPPPQPDQRAGGSPRPSPRRPSRGPFRPVPIAQTGS